MEVNFDNLQLLKQLKSIKQKEIANNFSKIVEENCVKKDFECVTAWKLDSGAVAVHGVSSDAFRANLVLGLFDKLTKEYVEGNLEIDFEDLLVGILRIAERYNGKEDE